jgi:hypothetical protein
LVIGHQAEASPATLCLAKGLHEGCVIAFLLEQLGAAHGPILAEPGIVDAVELKKKDQGSAMEQPRSNELLRALENARVLLRAFPDLKPVLFQPLPSFDESPLSAGVDLLSLRPITKCPATATGEKTAEPPATSGPLGK